MTRASDREASSEWVPDCLFGDLAFAKWRFRSVVLNFAAPHNDRI
jgi:hypothetical protein